MSDLHDDLLEMFRRREGDVRSPASAPTELIGRTRRREWFSAGVGVAVALLVVVVSVAGLRSLGASQGPQPGDTEPTTTKTISGITITYPERWFAEDPRALGIEPTIDGTRTLPTLVLTLTRDDPHNEGVLGCPLLADVPAGQLLMTVQETPLALSGEASAPWPVPLRTWPDIGGDLGCYPGWSGMRASWTAEGRSFEARLGFSPEATDADRSAMTHAFTSMTFAPGSVSTQDTVEVATGVTDSGATWPLTASMTGDLCWGLEVESGNSGSGAGGCSDGQEINAPDLIPLHVDPTTTVFAGTVPDDVDLVVEIDIPERGGGPIRIDGTSLIAPPSEAWGNVRLLIFEAPGSSGTAAVRFLDANSNELYPPRAISWDATGGLSQPMADVPNGRQLPWQILGGRVTTSERFAGVNWKLEVLYYLDGVRLTVGDSPEDLGVLRMKEPIVRPLGVDGFDALIFVLTDTSVERVSVASGESWDGRWMPGSTGAGGEARLWILEVPGAGTGDLLLDGTLSGEVHWP